MRGTVGGKGDAVVDSGAEVNPAAQRAFEVHPSGSNTLQSRDSGSGETVRATLIEATVDAIAVGSAPRLHQSRS
jgi:hypothetical protein